MSGVRVHRLIIDAWPTPDGQPFWTVDEDVWQSAVDFWAGGNDGAVWPEWLPEGIDFSNRVWPDRELSQMDLVSGHWVGGENLILIVPSKPQRVHWFSKQAAQKRVDTLTEWGVKAHIETSEAIVWAGSGVEG